MNHENALVFDRNPSLPRTAAHFKGARTFEHGKMAWVDVKFSKDQFFELFPLGLLGEWRPIFKAIQHVSWRLDDKNAAKRWPAARLAIRQAALDKKIIIRGHRSAELMSGSRWNEVETDIPGEYWETADFAELAADPQSENAMHTFPHRFSDGWFGDKIFLYSRLRVKWSEIVEVWPAC